MSGSIGPAVVQSITVPNPNQPLTNGHNVDRVWYRFFSSLTDLNQTSSLTAAINASLGTLTSEVAVLQKEVGTLAANASPPIHAIGAGLALNGGTVSLAAISASSLMGNAATVAGEPVGIALGANLSFSGNTLVASGGTGTVYQIVAGAGLTGGTITSSGTIALDPFAAGITLTTGTIYADYSAGTLGTFNTGLTLASGTLTPNWQAPVISTIGAGLTIATAGTLSADLAAIGAGLALNSGTVSLAAIAATTLLGNSGSVAATPTAIAIGANVTLAGGTLSVANSGTGTVTDIATSGSGISGGPITGSGTLAVEWNAGTVSAIGAGLTLSAGGTLSTTADADQWTAGTVSAISGQFTIASGTLNVGTLAYSSLPASADIRTLSFSLIGAPPSGQVFSLPITQAGTLLANGGTLAVRKGANPTATQTLVVSTEHSGTVTAQGTISINTTGTVTGPTFSAVAIAAGDSVDITNQATADTSFANWSFGLQFQVT